MGVCVQSFPCKNPLGLGTVFTGAGSALVVVPVLQLGPTAKGANQNVGAVLSGHPSFLSGAKSLKGKDIVSEHCGE